MLSLRGVNSGDAQRDYALVRPSIESRHNARISQLVVKVRTSSGHRPDRLLCCNAARSRITSGALRCYQRFVERPEDPPRFGEKTSVCRAFTWHYKCPRVLVFCKRVIVSTNHMRESPNSHPRVKRRGRLKRPPWPGCILEKDTDGFPLGRIPY